MARRGTWLAHDDGQGLVEYALILALTSLGMVMAVLLLRDSLGSPVANSSGRLDAVTAEAPAGANPGTPADGALDLAAPPAGASGGQGRGDYGKGTHGQGKDDGSSETRHRDD